jgi:phosphoglycolate phosphatase-like HAD superfamily hydrolase
MIKGVIFDLDGTLFEADYDWPAIKRRLGLPNPDGSIMDYLRSLPEGEREQNERLLEEIEDRATAAGRLKPGAAELLDYLHGQGLITALVTNNRQRNVQQILERYGLRFEQGRAASPSPQARPCSWLRRGWTWSQRS